MKKTLLCLLKVIVLVGFIIFPACKESDTNTSSPLVGVSWQLQSIALLESNVIPVPERITVLFKSDETVALSVDCNTCFCNYTAYEPNALYFGTPSCTEAYCGVNSHDLLFKTLLSYVYEYEITGDTLRVTFMNPTTSAPGYLTFQRSN